MTPALNLDVLSAEGRRGPAEPSSIADTEEKLGITFPADLRAFLLQTDGYEGWIGENYAQLYRATDISESQLSYFDEDAPGFVMIGSNGAGEAFGYDTRSSPWRMVMMPMIGMEWDVAIPIGVSFADFLALASVHDLFDLDEEENAS